MDESRSAPTIPKTIETLPKPTITQNVHNVLISKFLTFAINFRTRFLNHDFIPPFFSSSTSSSPTLSSTSAIQFVIPWSSIARISWSTFREIEFQPKLQIRNEKFDVFDVDTNNAVPKMLDRFLDDWNRLERFNN